MKIYVAMHKIVHLDLPESYEPLLVGSYNKKSENITRDDEGDNISKLNENFCELTGMYYIWKNSKEDIVGLCHYRRFLSKKVFSNDKKYYLNEDDIKSLFEKGYNMILPKKNFYKKNIYNSLNVAPNKEDMAVTRNVLEKLYPEYTKAYDKYMNSHSSYLCNVLVCDKKIFDEYSKWLFEILFEIENVMDKDTYINDSYRKRMFGFLSERLLNVWVIHNKNKLKIKEYALINTEEKKSNKIIRFIKQSILKIIFRN